MEKSWTIAAEDGAIIHGLLDHSSDEPSDSCVVIVHGLSGYPNEYLHKITARFFSMRGYDVLRPALYDEKPDARRLRDCTLATHAADLSRVLAGPAADYKNLFLIGHSYGGPTIMIAQPQNARAVSLLDPSFNLPRLWAMLPCHKEGGLVFDGHGIEHVLNPAMMDEAALYDEAHCLALSRSFKPPIQVIHADGNQGSDGTAIYNAPDEVSWHSAGNPANERHLIAGADHCFCTGTTLDTVLDLTERWFQRHA